ncbi:ACT domain-containing protein [Streptococcus thermophilus CNCM I-1630]|nr:ACT domain-containing protein [Streptococcus thermophilus CNCM I-1630]
MKAIITVVGKDKAGIVAGVATKIAELGLNIDDITQTSLMNSYHDAVVSSEDKKDFTHLRADYKLLVTSLHVKINIQSSAINDAMHN